MPEVGDRYEPVHGVAWSDGNSPDDAPRGYYPMNADGSFDDSIRLRWVDDAPGNPEDGSGHFEVMRREAGYGYFHGQGGRTPSGGMTGGVAAPVVVPLEAHAKGKAKVEEPPEQPRKTRVRWWT